MRPSYTYHDKQDKRKQEKSKADDPEEEENEPEPQQVCTDNIKSLNIKLRKLNLS